MRLQRIFTPENYNCQRMDHSAKGQDEIDGPFGASSVYLTRRTRILGVMGFSINSAPILADPWGNLTYRQLWLQGVPA